MSSAMITEQLIKSRVVEESLFDFSTQGCTLQPNDLEGVRNRIKELLEEKNTRLIAHYYTDSKIQELADETGGCVSDSLEMARFGRDDSAQNLVVAGVEPASGPIRTEHHCWQ